VVRYSFLVGIFHSLLHAGLSRRSLQTNALSEVLDAPSFDLRAPTELCSPRDTLAEKQTFERVPEKRNR
jgi:hypothetical protein